MAAASWSASTAAAVGTRGRLGVDRRSHGENRRATRPLRGDREARAGGYGRGAKLVLPVRSRGAAGGAGAGDGRRLWQ